MSTTASVELRQRYPYLYAYMFASGSPSQNADGLAETAAADGAPEDSYVRRDWAVQKRSELAREVAEQAAAAGHAWFSVDEHGQRQRVYFRVGVIADPVLREQLDRYAHEYRAGKSPTYHGDHPLTRKVRGTP